MAATSNTTTIALMITLLVLLLVSLASITTLYFLRRARARQIAAQKADGILPFHASSEKPLQATYKPSTGSRRSRHRRLGKITIASHMPFRGSNNSRRKSEPEHSFVEAEKREFLATTSSAPTSPLPQIHITFPEEVDDTTGQVKQGSGRVVKVFVDDKGSVGMEPVSDAESQAALAKQQSEGRFVSLDLDRMGGLKEKEFRG